MIIKNADSLLLPQLSSSAVKSVIAIKVNYSFFEKLNEKSYYPNIIEILLLFIAYNK